jgi:phosphoserine aminotransferase
MAGTGEHTAGARRADAAGARAGGGKEVGGGAGGSGASTERPLNFAGGPALLPAEVLREAQEHIWSHAGTGVGILETGHRSREFDRVLEEAERDLRAAGGIPDTHAVLFLPGGAQMLFALVPLNALRSGDRAAFLVTGTWPQRALADAGRAAALVGADARALWDGAATGFRALPAPDAWQDDPGARYLHYCSNNTIEGTQWREPPASAAPLVCDATSDILSRPWPFARHAVVFAGAQKNLGIAGLTVAVVERAYLDTLRDGLPLMTSLREHAKAGSRLNTPPTFAIWMAGRMAAWILRQGGVAALAERNQRKAACVYAAVDESGGFYTGAAARGDRSMLNASFRCPTPALDAAFTADAARAGMVGLEGHRTAGGIRASLYNALPMAGAERLAAFMREFARTRG